jgi:DNA-binding transcriptional ArsR family regulator
MVISTFIDVLPRGRWLLMRRSPQPGTHRSANHLPSGGAALTSALYFYISGFMEKKAALIALAALAQESRLDIFRVLVQAGADGMPAGHIGEQLGLPSATLAFHLKELKNAGLVTFTRNGRSLIYAAEYPAMNALLSYLTENCCGRPANLCLPTCQPEAGANPVLVKTRNA